MRIAPSVAAMSLGDTQNMMLANLARCSSLIMAGVAAWHGADLAWIAAAGFFGEVIALFVSVWRLERRKPHIVRASARPILVGAVGPLAAAIAAHFGASEGGWVVVVAASCLFGLATCFMLLAALPVIRQHIWHLIRGRHGVDGVTAKAVDTVGAWRIAEESDSRSV